MRLKTEVVVKLFDVRDNYNDPVLDLSGYVKAI